MILFYRNHVEPGKFVCDAEPSENGEKIRGDCYGFHLIYSGNHCETAEVSSFGKLRLLTGINPREFSWKLEPGAQFQAPEAFMTYARRMDGEA